MPIVGANRGIELRLAGVHLDDGWQGDFLKPELAEPSTVDEDILREVAAACPTQAIVLEQVVESAEIPTV